MTPQRLQELKAGLAKLSPEAQRRVMKAVRASMDVQQFKYLCTQVNRGLATPQEYAEYKTIMESSARTLG